MRGNSTDADTKTVAHHMGLSLLLKGGSLLVSLLITPALIRYFDHNEVLGLWYTLLSVLLWVLHLDIGLGNGLRNRLTQELSTGDRAEARRTLSTGFFSLLGMALLLLPVGLLLIGVSDLNHLFAIDPATIPPATVKAAAALIFAGMLLRYVLGGVTAALYSVQLSSVNHLLHMAAGVLELLFLWTEHPHDTASGLLFLAAAYALHSNIPTLAAGFWLFSKWGRLADCRPSLALVDKDRFREMMRMGVRFFTCQIGLVVIANTNEMLISACFGTEYTTDYAICHRLGSLVSMLITPMLTPVWSMFTRAQSRGDRAWLRKTYRRLRLFGAIAVGLQFVLTLFQPLLLRLWLGDAVPPDTSDPLTVLIFAFAGAVTIDASVLATVASGLSRLRCQVWGYALGAALKLGGVFLLAPVVDNWRLVVVWYTLSLLPYCIGERMAMRRFLREENRVVLP